MATLIGLAAPYNQEIEINGQRESIATTAFADIIDSQREVKAYVDHDPTKLLARRANSTLELFDRNDGLHVRIQLPSTQLGSDVQAMAESGLLSGMSIGFRLQGRRSEDDDALRTTDLSDFKAYARRGLPSGILDAIDLREVSILTGREPAYKSTYVKIATDERSLNMKMRYFELAT